MQTLSARLLECLLQLSCFEAADRRLCKALDRTSVSSAAGEALVQLLEQCSRQGRSAGSTPTSLWQLLPAPLPCRRLEPHRCSLPAAMADNDAAIIRAACRLLPYYGRLPAALHGDAGRRETFKAVDELQRLLGRAKEEPRPLPAAVVRWALLGLAHQNSAHAAAQAALPPFLACPLISLACPLILGCYPPPTPRIATPIAAAPSSRWSRRLQPLWKHTRLRTTAWSCCTPGCCPACCASAWAS